MKIRPRYRPSRTADDRDSEKPKSDDAADRLSELPDSLIREIVSLLPMRVIVRTTVLSKRWKDLWITLPCFNFKEIWERKPEEFFSSPSFSSIHEQLTRTSVKKVEIAVTWHSNDLSLYDLLWFLMNDGKRIERVVVKSIGGTEEEFTELVI